MTLTEGRGADVVIEVVGSTPAVRITNSHWHDSTKKIVGSGVSIAKAFWLHFFRRSA